MPQVASMGAAVAVADFDRDGWQDFYVTNSREGSLNRLYRNKGDGTFEDVAPSHGVADVNRRETGVSMGAVWGDYDNDGYEDLFLYDTGARSSSATSRGSGSSPSVSGPACRAGSTPTARRGSTTTATAVSISSSPATGTRDVNLWKLATTRIMPESFEYANNGGRKYLLRNRGDGTFEDRTEALGISSRRWTLAVAAGDLLGTGYPDLFLANDYGVSELFANRGGKAFVDVGRETGVEPDAEERHERLIRRRVQRRPARDLQDQHLRAGRAGAGQRPVGAQG